MVNATPLKASFNAGELSPRLAGRVDLAKYFNGQEVLENLIPLAEGGVTRRPGSRYIAEVKDSSKATRLKGFEFSTEQAYQIEMGEQYLRFYRNQGQITVANTDAAISNGTFAAGITDWDDRSTGTAAIAHDATNDRLSLVGASASVAWAEQDVTTTNTSQEHVLRFRVLGAAGDSIQLRIGTTSTGSEIVADFEADVGWHAYAFTPTASPFYVQFRNGEAKTLQIDDVSLIDDAAVEVTTPYLEAQLYDVDGPQSADVLYLFHSSHPTYKLSRRGNTTWSLTEVAWSDGPWRDENVTATTLTAGAATGYGVTVTASATTGINGGQGFLSTDVGRLIRMSPTPEDWGWARIVGVTSTTVVTVDVERDVPTTATTRWRLGAWSGTTGYPGTGAFFEQRLAAARTTDQPQTFWLSQTGDFENHAPDSPTASGTWDGTIEDDDALDYTISADNVNAIEWLSPGEDTLAIGTRGGEWVPKAAGQVLTPTDISVRRQTTHGSARVVPARVGHVVLFVQRAKRKIREFGFTFEVDGWVANDMTRLSQHITKGGVVQMAYQQEPDSLVWFCRGDGQLICMTYRRDEDVVAFSRHIFGGSFGSGNAVCESVSTIPGNDGAGQTKSSEARDEVWVIVKRTINGATKRYVEMLEKVYDEAEDDQEDAYYADSLLTYDGASTSTITGLDHLEGQTVKVWADGAIQPDATVSSGSITMDTAASVVQVGLQQTWKFKSYKLDFGGVTGSSVGRPKRIEEVTLILRNAHIISAGPDFDDLTEYDFREVADSMDEAAPLFTGEYVVDLTADWQTDPRLALQGTDPAPFSLLAISFKMKTNEL